MTPLKIGIVEDDLIIAQSISEMLIESGYSVTKPAKRYSEAISMVEDEHPDLLLLDVKILGTMDGIEVARTVKRTFGIPFIFLTANTDFETIARAKEVIPAAFLAKPITKAQLYVAIEIAMATTLFGRNSDTKLLDGAPAAPKVLFVKDGQSYRKIDETEIVYIESDQNYVIIHLANGHKVTVRSTITEFESAFSPGSFMRVHRSFMVAPNRISAIAGTTLVAGQYSIPIGRNYRDGVLRVLGIRK